MRWAVSRGQETNEAWSRVLGLLAALPWVQSFLVKGLGAGRAMILLIAGVGTNVSTLSPVAQVMGRVAPPRRRAQPTL